MAKIKVLFLSQQKLLRESLKASFLRESEFEYLEPVETTEEAIAAIFSHEPKVVLMDVNPSLFGIRAAKQLHVACPGCKVLVVASRLPASAKIQLALTGVQGVLTKDIGVDALFWAIREACNGKRVYW